MPQSSLKFKPGSRLRRASHILPVFLPFAGCPGRCVFCAQDKQTGNRAAHDAHGRQAVLDALEHRLDHLYHASQLSRPNGSGEQPLTWELAFFGGTFTALPSSDRTHCLQLFRTYHQRGVLSHARCSTRPDAVTAATLAELRAAGLDLVELGIQSFQDSALQAARRGYDTTTALTACQEVKKAGLKLGIQLLPGMPGVTPQIFLEDVQVALQLRPDIVRFYPCLVLEDTPLAALWVAQRYTPWTVEETIRHLGRALSLAWEAQIPVIRLAVAPEPTFDACVVAGPRHPALGSMIQGEALRLAVAQRLATLSAPPRAIHLPRSCQGYMYGHRNALRSWWQETGLFPEHIVFYDGEEVCVHPAPDRAGGLTGKPTQ